LGPAKEGIYVGTADPVAIDPKHYSKMTA